MMYVIVFCVGLVLNGGLAVFVAWSQRRRIAEALEKAARDSEEAARQVRGNGPDEIVERGFHRQSAASFRHAAKNVREWVW